MAEKLEDIELRSDEVQEILEKVPSWIIRRGNVLLFVLLIMLFVISYFVKYPDIITSQVIITTHVPPQKEYARSDGKLQALFVTQNQKVAKGQLLAIIENTANHEDVFFLKQIVDTISTEKTGFTFPLETLPALFLGEIEKDYALFENSYNLYLLNKELQPFSSQMQAGNETVLLLKKRLKNLELQYRLGASETEIKKNDLQRAKTLFEKGVISKQELDNKQLEMLEAERTFENLEVTISRTKEALGKEGFSNKKTEIEWAKEEKTLYLNTIQAFNQLKKALRKWELDYVLRSEISGTVSLLNFWAQGQSVKTGDLLFTIVPLENAGYIAKLKTPSLNSGKIKVGQSVNIKLENYPDTEFGMLQGHITNISLMSDEEGFYLIDVQLPEKLITTYKKEIDFKQEMRGTAEIITEDLRLMERFFYQFKEVFKR